MYDEKRRKGEMMAAIEMGMAKGRAEGLEQGKAEAHRKNALRLMELGVDVGIIAQATGLSVEDIEALAPAE